MPELTTILPPDPISSIVKLDLNQAQSDLNDCLNASQSADTCCNNPSSCGGTDNSSQISNLQQQIQDASSGGDAQSIKAICDQANQAGALSASMFNSFAHVCSASHNGCSVKCQSSYSTWLARSSKCQDGCDITRLNNILAQFNAAKQSCDALVGQENNYARQASSQASNAGTGQICSRRASNSGDSTTNSSNPSNPFNTNTNTNANPNPSANTALAEQSAPSPIAPPSNLPVGSSECGALANVSSCMNCAEHPEYPSCGGGAGRDTPTAQATQTQPSGPINANELFSSPAAQSKLNAANPSNPLPSGSVAPMYPGAMPPPPPPGQNIGSFPPLNPNDLSGSLLVRAKMLAAKKGINTDILRGVRSGGYSSAPSSGSGFEKWNAASAGIFSRPSERSYVGMDLKQYLPGHERGPRRIAGVGVGNPEIAPMSADMFQRVSLRFRIVCDRDQLLDCGFARHSFGRPK